MAKVRVFNPTLDAGLVNIGDGTVRKQTVLIESGEVALPVWARTESGLVVRINELPWQGVLQAGQMEFLSSDPAAGGGLSVADYSLTRPLLQNNPGALLDGDDWSDLTQQSDVEGQGFSLGATGAEAGGTLNPTDPSFFMAHFEQDPVFGNVVRMFLTDLVPDGSGRNHCRFGVPGWTAVDRCWYRWAFRWDPTYNSRTDPSYGGEDAHKFLFTSSQRTILHQGADRQRWSAEGWSNAGGSTALLPNAPDSRTTGKFFRQDNDGEGATPFQPCYSGEGTGGVPGDGHHYEFVHYEEALSSTSHRLRSWFREISDGSTFNETAVQVYQANALDDSSRDWTLEGFPGVPCKRGLVQTGMPAGSALGRSSGWNHDTRNGYCISGQTWGWRLCRWEAIDGDVIADPYGLAGDML